MSFKSAITESTPQSSHWKSSPAPGQSVRRCRLSSGQHRIWFISQLQSGLHAYNIPSILRVRGMLPIALIQQSLDRLVQRHEALRTGIMTEGGQPVALIHAQRPVVVGEVDLSGTAEGQREAQALAAIKAEIGRGFELAGEPLLRVVHYRLSATDHFLVFNIHHIICDGWSLGIFFRELSEIYGSLVERSPLSLAELKVNFADYVYWQEERLQGALAQRHKDYWSSQLRDCPVTLALPSERPRPPRQSMRGARYYFSIPAPLTQAVKAFSRRENQTLFMALFSVFAILLHRYSDQESMLIGTPMAGRHNSDFEKLMGLFVNTLVLRVDLRGVESIRDLLKQVRATARNAFAHSELPFERLVDEQGLARDLSHHPLFQVAFALHSMPLAPVKLSGLEVERLEMDNGTSKFDLFLSLEDQSRQLSGFFEYNTDLFDVSSVERWSRQYMRLLEQVVSRPETRLNELMLLEEGERRRILEDWNRTEQPYESRKGFIGLFENWVKAQPTAEAVVYEGERWDYERLNRRANQVARHLVELGLPKEGLVGIYLERHPDLIASVLGVMKAGGAYVPLDPSYPPERLGFMIQDSGLEIVLTQRALATPMKDKARNLICLDEMAPEETAGAGENPGVMISAHNLAYVIYTSGSTGKPKGVLLEHGGLCNVAHEQVRLFGVGPGHRVLQFSSLSFDAFVFETAMALGSGATLVLAPRERLLPGPDLIDLLLVERISVITMPPSALGVLPEADLPDLKIITVAGEACPAALVDRWGRGKKFFNLYGPTETTIWATAAQLQPGSGHPPIGRPIANIRAYVLDGQGQAIPEGVVGELHLGGAGLARGYLGQPGLTEERFATHQLARRGKERLYRTGDLARWRKDGQLEFVGRNDGQVKVRGFRIELSEVEAILGSHPEVQDCAVLAQDTEGSRRLVAFVAARPGAEVDPECLRSFLKLKLPDYMLPSVLTMRDALPLTLNGKVDRLALSRLEIEAQPGEYVAPRNDQERALAEIWAEVLRLDKVGVTDNFFVIGGDSILSIQIVARANRAGIDLTPVLMFQNQTIAELASALIPKESGTDTPPSSLSTPRRPSDMAWPGLDRETLSRLLGQGDEIEDIYPLTPLQQGMLFHHLDAAQDGLYIPQVVWSVEGHLDEAAFEDAWRRVVQRHTVLRTSFLWQGVSEPLQRVHRQGQLAWQVLDWRGDSSADQQARLEDHLNLDRARPFDLSRPALLRMYLLKRTDHSAYFVWSMHHLILDGWCLPVIWKEVLAIYRNLTDGCEAALDTPRPFRDYIAWLQGQNLVEAEKFWRQQMKGWKAPTTLGMAHVPESWPSGTPTHREMEINLPAEVTSSLQDLVRSRKLTLATLMQGAWAILLSHYSGEEEVLFGMTASGRSADLADVDRMLGLFINGLPMRVRVPSGAALIPWLQELQEQQARARQFEHTPLRQIQAWSQVPGDQPLFESVFVYRTIHWMKALVHWQGPGLEFNYHESGGWIDTPLEVTVVPGAQLKVTIKFDQRRFESEVIERLLGHYEHLVRGMAADPGQTLLSYPLAPDRESPPPPVSGPVLSRDFPPDFLIFEASEIESTLVARFESQARLHGEDPALMGDGKMWTYGELNIAANGMARALLEARGSGFERVALLFSHGAGMIPAMLGVLKAGKAYVPLDPAHPPDRLRGILADSGALALLTEEAHLGLACQVGGDGMLVLESGRIQSTGLAPNPGLALAPATEAYILYTSGSTGQPKGIVQSHKNVLHFIRAYTNQLGLGSSDRLTLFSSYGHDAAVVDIYAALLNGASLYPFDPKSQGIQSAVDWLGRNKITVFHSVPTLFRTMTDAARHSHPLPDLRYVVLGGETVYREDFENYRKRLGDRTRLVNLHGSTESTINALFMADKNTRLRRATLPIGRSVPGGELLLLDRQGRPAEVYGELVVRGPHVALGYHGQPDWTRKSFREDAQGRRLYWSGDLGRRLPDGNLEFAGRRDFQIKVRGYRVEPGEIEAAMMAHPGIRQAAVVGWERQPGEMALAAYYVGNDAALTPQQWGAFLRSKLPDPMIPETFEQLQALPLTASGKVDRRALPLPEYGRSRTDTAYVAPRTPIEETLVEIWSEVLGVESVGIQDNFFALGGHSLRAMQVVVRIHDHFQVDLPVRSLFESRTVEDLALLVLEHLMRLDEEETAGLPPDGRPSPGKELRSDSSGASETANRLSS